MRCRCTSEVEMYLLGGLTRGHSRVMRYLLRLVISIRWHMAGSAESGVWHSVKSRGYVWR